MANDLQCWKCGAALAALSLPLRRLDECPQCRAELHVCRLCVVFDRRAYQQCREPTVEEVRDKTRANFCDHFKPRRRRLGRRRQRGDRSSAIRTRQAVR